MTLLLRIRPIYRPLYLLLPSVPKQAWIHHSSRLLQLPPTPPISPYNSQSQTPLTSTDSELELELDDVLDHFQAPIRYAFAYGSGVFRQQGYTSNSAPQIDLIFGVTHPQHWHSLNLKQNPSHYSAYGILGSNAIKKLQENYGGGVYYNPFVDIHGMRVKYGVVSIETLCRDLVDWETLYLAGRMQKPIKILRDFARIKLCNQTNLANAVRVALLQLPEEFSEEELFMKITGISYKGDPRMIIGENYFKVYNIVYAQFPAFRKLYASTIEALPNVSYIRPEVLRQDMNVKLRSNLVQKLPLSARHKIELTHRWYLSRIGETVKFHTDSLGQDIRDQIKGAGSVGFAGNVEESKFLASVVSSPEVEKYVDQALIEIVRGPAITQTLKGVITAGLSKSLKYAGEKLRKWWSSKKQGKPHLP